MVGKRGGRHHADHLEGLALKRASPKEAREAPIMEIIVVIRICSLQVQGIIEECPRRTSRRFYDLKRMKRMLMNVSL